MTVKPDYSVIIKKPTILKYGFRFLYVFGSIAAAFFVSVIIFEQLHGSLSFVALVYALLGAALALAPILFGGMLIERAWTRTLIRNVLLANFFGYKYVYFSLFRTWHYSAEYQSGWEVRGELRLKPEKLGWLMTTSTYDLFEEEKEPALAR